MDHKEVAVKGGGDWNVSGSRKSPEIQASNCKSRTLIQLYE